jgi:MOSC domain-containing protein YiiM
MSGEVFSIQLCPGRRQAMQRVIQARACEDFGLAGDSHARSKSRRQVLLIEQETLLAVNLPVGAVKENITTRGIDLMKLSPGQQLQLGECVRLELTGPCEPCSRMDEVRTGLKAELEGRRGMLAKVVAGGMFSVGDAVRVVGTEVGSGTLGPAESES